MSTEIKPSEERVEAVARAVAAICGYPVGDEVDELWLVHAQDVLAAADAVLPPQAAPSGEAVLDLPALCDKIARHLGSGWLVVGPDGSRFQGETPHRAANAASKHYGRMVYDPAKAAEFADVVAEAQRKSAEENERLLEAFGSLDCPACGGSGHVGDTHPAPAPAAVPAGYTVLEDGKTMIPNDWTWCRMEWEPGYPEDVAFGPVRMMARLKKWLTAYFALIQQPKTKPDHDAWKCDRCHGDGWHYVEREGVDWRDIVSTKEECGLCGGLGWIGPDAKAAAEHAKSQTASPPPSTERGWRPIETAPKDGSKILLFYLNANGKARRVVGGWVTEEEAAETDTDGVGLEAGWYERIDNWGDFYQVAIHEGEPTHWMPLPPPPSQPPSAANEQKGVA